MLPFAAAALGASLFSKTKKKKKKKKKGFNSLKQGTKAEKKAYKKGMSGKTVDLKTGKVKKKKKKKNNKGKGYLGTGGKVPFIPPPIGFAAKGKKSKVLKKK